MALTSKKPIVGIIGGMGPMATCDLFKKIIDHTSAHKDQEHVHLIIDNNTSIPDRTAHILGHGEDPLPEMKKVITKLIFDGASVLAMPCNTAHYYYDDLLAYARDLKQDVEFIHMIEETAKYCKLQGYTKVMLFATLGTYESGLYLKFFKAQGIELIYPPEDEREIIMEAVYGYKSDAIINTKFYEDTIELAVEEGANAFILGCTELPLILQNIKSAIPMVDPAEVLADTIAQLR